MESTSKRHPEPPAGPAPSRGGKDDAQRQRARAAGPASQRTGNPNEGKQRGLGRVEYRPGDGKVALVKPNDAANFTDYSQRNLLILQVGNREYNFVDSDNSNPVSEKWLANGLHWSGGERVPVRLVKLLRAGPPTRVRAVATASGSIEAEWDPPAYPLVDREGRPGPLDHYQIQVLNGQKVVHRQSTADEHDRTAVVHFLEGNINHTVRVRAAEQKERGGNTFIAAGSWEDAATTTVRTGGTAVTRLSLETDPNQSNSDTIGVGERYHFRVYATGATDSWSGDSYSGVDTEITIPGYSHGPSFLSRHLRLVDSDDRPY